MGKILLYGCTGYTGKLMAFEAARRKMDVVLAGRNPASVEEIAKATGLPYVIASLNEPKSLEAALDGISVVLHCAGPFVLTAPPMLTACLNKGVHYLDITGEIDVFEGCAMLSKEAQQAGVMLMPGVGFDVVPTDCLAVRLKAAMPDAIELELIIRNMGGGVSHGTASTMLQTLGTGSKIRKDGKIISVPIASPILEADFGNGPKKAAGLPWGDVSTAYYTTGIPNIVVAFAMPAKSIRNLRRMRFLNFLLKQKWVKNIIQKQIDKRPAGPSDTERRESKSMIFGRVRNAKSEVKEMLIETPNGYELTVLTGLHIAQRVQNGEFKIGFQTPAGCFGEKVLDAALAERTV